MKLRLLLLSLSLGLVLPAFSQIDVTQLTADTKTFIFDDDKNTVKNYIYQELEVKTSCCGAARIYLEVKIAPSGYVLSAKTLTGKNDCYKKSAIDIVKNIKWNAAGFQGPKSVYFEIKPEVDCGDRANAYEALPIFNNGELDVNGVPVNYANSTGVSALKSSGAPTGVPNPTVDPALASNEPAENEGETATGNEAEKIGAGENETTNEVAENNPPAENTGADAGEAEKSEPIAEANTPPATNTTATPAKNELEKARQAAALREDREKQASEIEKLKAELEAVKKQEEDRKAREAEQTRLASAEKERQEMEEARQKREEQNRERRAAQRDREEQDRYADNSRNNDRNSRDSRSGGYDDNYADNRRNDRDRNDGYGDTDPPRQMSEAQRKEDEKRKLDDELRDIQNRMREMDDQQRRNEADRRRAQQDLARIQERALLKGEEIQQAREREELEKLKLQRTEAEQKKREQEELLRRVMDEIKRMQMDMERKMADMERLEKELKDRQAQELTYGQEVTKNQEMRKAEIERQIDAIKMQAGIASGGSTAAPASGGAPAIPINISANDSNAISILAQQIAQLRNEISNLQNYVVNSQGGGSYATNAPNRTRSASRTPITTTGNNAAKKPGSWNKVDYRNPNDKKAEIYNSFGSGEGVKKAKEHKNMTVGKMAEPKFAGNTEAMKKEVAQKLQAGGICGLVQTTFIVTVAPNGEVVGYDITFANTPSVQLQLGGILKNLKFQSTPTTRMNSRALYELKAEIVCEGEERINIKDVPDLINQ